MICFLALTDCYDYFVFRFTTVIENHHSKIIIKVIDKNCFCFFVLNRWSYGIVMWEVFTIGMCIVVKKNFKAT